MTKRAEPVIVHTLPGRCRLRVPGLKNNPRLIGLINGLTAVPGIFNVSVGSRTESVLLLYNSRKISAGKILFFLGSACSHLNQAAASAAVELESYPHRNIPHMEVPEIIDLLKTSPLQGLAHEEAGRRLAFFGPNRLISPPSPGMLARMAAQMKDFLVQTLLGSSLVCAVMGEVVDSAAIILILTINAFLGAVQERKAEGALSALKEMTAPTARTLREGSVQMLPADKLVPGDIVALEQGDGVPADIRLIEAVRLEAEEAALTGESNPVVKNADPAAQCVSTIDCHNMLFMGTSVIRGKSRGVVVSTGLDTEIGKISSLLRENRDERTPLQDNLAGVGATVLKASLLASGAVAALGLLRGGPPVQMLLTGVSLAVAAIPEGLPAIVTIAMASGVHKMAGKNAIVKNLSAVETIGETTVICSDKTGTLTHNEQTVVSVYCPEEHWWRATGSGYDHFGGYFVTDGEERSADAGNLKYTLTAASLCCNATLARVESPGGAYWKVNGDPSEGAILVAARKAGIETEQLLENYNRIYEEPFDSGKRKMHVVCRNIDNSRYVFVKGAIDTVLSSCSFVRAGEGEGPLEEGPKSKITAAGDAMAGRALRVFAVAYRKIDMDKPSPPTADGDLTFLGLLGMMDPLRKEVVESIKKCRSAGISVKMITGDHPYTAMAIGRQLGIVDNGGPVITSRDIVLMNEQELGLAARNTNVFARILPEHKLRLVQSLKKQGETVAMIGDGVNDAPAVKEASVGVAMGLKGTDVTRQAADLILTDDNFSTVVTAIEQGRGIYQNIKKSVRYLLATNAGEVSLTLLAVAVGLPLPLLPIQLLWLNLLGDALPAVALGVDPIETDIIKSPFNNNKKFFDSDYTKKIASHGALAGLATFGAYYAGLRTMGVHQARTIALSTITIDQLLHALDVRKDTKGGAKGANPFLYVSLGLSAALLAATIYWPPARRVFKTTTLGWPGLGITLSASTAAFLLDKALQSIINKPNKPKEGRTKHESIALPAR